MTEAIERAARALAKIDGYDPDEDPNYVDGRLFTQVAFPPGTRLWHRYERKARAVIDSVLLDPSEEVVEAVARIIDLPPWNPAILATASPGYADELTRRKEDALLIARAALRAAGLAITGRTE